MQERSEATCHMVMLQCCYLSKEAKRPSNTTNMISIFPDLCNPNLFSDLCNPNLFSDFLAERLFTSPKINLGCTSPKINLSCTSPKINLGCTSPKKILSCLLYGSVASLRLPSSNIEAWSYGTSLRSGI